MASSYYQRAFPAVVAVAALLTLPALACAQASADLESEESKTFYALGLALAQNLGPFALTESELEWVVRGLSDSVLGREAQVDATVYVPKLQAIAQERMAARAVEEKAAGEAFLAEKGTEAGAEKRESGLILTEIKPGTGASPTPEDTVNVHYHGTLRDGTVFDSSVERGSPVSFPLTAVIPCWTEALQSMKVGGKSRLICPADIAYGDQGRPPQIPPGAVLVFDVELLGIVTDDEGEG